MTKEAAIFLTTGFLFILSSCAIFRSNPEKPTEKEYIISWDDSEYDYSHELEKSHIDTTNNVQSLSSDDFYQKYSKILGVPFLGTENRELLIEISEWLGTKYAYGVSEKQKWTDCSGFVRNIYLKVYGIDLQRSSLAMSENSVLIEMDELKEGDLVFFKIKAGRISHVGLYLKDGFFIHASTKAGVIVSNLSEKYYKDYFYKGGRVVVK
ncbi:MAG: C40 family peptidase [Bacteroidota bacterium]